MHKPSTLGLTKVFNPVTRNGAAHVVFIHGLGGHPRETWMSNPQDDTTLWPKWVGSDTGCPVWLLGYEAAISGWKADAMAIRRQGGAVLEMLSAEPDLDGPLVLVGHSLGGLVIKAAVEHGIHRGARYQKELIRRIEGVAFVGTPHFGSALADIVSWFRLARPNPQVHDLRSGDPNLEALNAGFLTFQQENRIQAIVYRETRGLRPPKWMGGRIWPGATVVNTSSADPHIPGASLVDLGEDHSTICKPQDRNAIIHKSLVAFVRRVNEINSVGALQAGGHQQSSDGFAAARLDEQESKPVHLALATSGLTPSNGESGSMTTVVCLVTDAPEVLRQQLIELRKSIAQDTLANEHAKSLSEHGTLKNLAEDPATRAAFMGKVAVIPFSAYLYYVDPVSLRRMPMEQRVKWLLVEPLAHRLSKKGERVAQVQTARADATELLTQAAERVRTQFGRIVPLPEPGKSRYSEFGQLASLLASCAAGHLQLPQDQSQSEIFRHLRTRVRFAENVATGEKHLRDFNPLP